MEDRVKNRAERMLAQAYRRLGILDPAQSEKWVREAMEYMELDREHYIEVAEPDVPEYMITETAGVICKRIPLAREMLPKRDKDCILERTTVFALMVAENAVRFITETSCRKLYADYRKDSWTDPVCRFANLDGLRQSFQLMPPRQIRPVATEADWKIYTMMFAVFDRCCQDRPVNTVPHKTERAMRAMTHARPEKLLVDRRTVIGKVIPLAVGQTHEELREDHRHSYASELCILVGEGEPRYLLKTRHTYCCFRKVNYDDVPGGCSYEPTGEKHDITWAFVDPENIRERLDPYYF